MEVAMNAICRSVANAPLRARHRFLLLVASIIASLVTLSSPPAGAMSDDQAVDVAVEAAARGAGWLGFSIPPAAAHVFKEIVKCGVVEGGSVADCAKKSVVAVALRNAPVDVQKIAGCMVSNPDPKGCAIKLGLEKADMPPEAKPMVECM